MKAYLDRNGVLHVEATETYESLALKAWSEKYEVQNVNGVLMIPSRALVLHHGPQFVPSN